MTDDFKEFLVWIFSRGWDVMKTIPVPGFENVNYADAFVATMIIGIAFSLLFISGYGARGGNSSRKSKEDNDD